MYCAHCGKTLNANSNFCVVCGARITPATAGTEASGGIPSVINAQPSQSFQEQHTHVHGRPDDRGGFWWGVLGFFLSGLIGIIIWAVMRRDFPRRARSILIGVIIGIIFGTIGMIILIRTGFWEDLLDAAFRFMTVVWH